MLRRGSLVVLLTLSVTACKGNSTNALTGSTQSRAPGPDAVLVFVSGAWSTDPGQLRELFSSNADGSKIEQLTACASAAQPCDLLQVALSSDHSRLVAARTTPDAAPGAAGLYFMDLSRSVEKLLIPRRKVSAVDWSADNSFLVYASTGDSTLSSGEDLYYCYPDGTSDQALTTTTNIRERSPRIDPGLRTAVYEQIDETGVGRIALFSQPPVVLTTGPTGGAPLEGTPYVVGADADPAFAPDASKIVYRRLTSVGNGGLGTWDLMTVGSDGSNQQTIVTGNLYRGAPDWGKSGIVFVETDAAAGSSQLVVVQADGSGRKVLLQQSAGFRMGSPRWIPGS